MSWQLNLVLCHSLTVSQRLHALKPWQCPQCK